MVETGSSEPPSAPAPAALETADSSEPPSAPAPAALETADSNNAPPSSSGEAEATETSLVLALAPTLARAQALELAEGIFWKHRK